MMKLEDKKGIGRLQIYGDSLLVVDRMKKDYHILNAWDFFDGAKHEPQALNTVKGTMCFIFSNLKQVWVHTSIIQLS